MAEEEECETCGKSDEVLMRLQDTLFCRACWADFGSDRWKGIGIQDAGAAERRHGSGREHRMKGKVHFEYQPENYPRAYLACGTFTSDKRRRTRDHGDVTCMQCQATDPFKRATAAPSEKDRLQARVAELEEHILSCQMMHDEGVADAKVIERLLTIFVGPGLARTGE